jgi:hypothetical protein
MPSFALILLCKVQDYAKFNVIGAHAERLQDPDHLPT